MADYKQHCTKAKTTVQVGSITKDRRSTFGFSIKAEGKKAPLVGAGVSMPERFILDPAQSGLNYPADMIAEHYTIDEALANAELISETFNVLNETGFTPEELVQQVNRLRKLAFDCRKTLSALNYANVENGGKPQTTLFDQIDEALTATEPKQ